LFYYILFLIKF